MVAVDPHKASWTAAAVDGSLQPLATVRVPVSRDGYRALRRGFGGHEILSCGPTIGIATRYDKYALTYSAESSSQQQSPPTASNKQTRPSRGT